MYIYIIIYNTSLHTYAYLFILFIPFVCSLIMYSIDITNKQGAAQTRSRAALELQRRQGAPWCAKTLVKTFAMAFGLIRLIFEINPKTIL